MSIAVQAMNHEAAAMRARRLGLYDAARAAYLDAAQSWADLADHAGRYGETIVESMYRQEADKQRRKADAMKDAAIWELVQ